LVHPVTDTGELRAADEELLRQSAEGRPIKAIAAAQRTSAAVVSDAVEQLFLKLAHHASSGAASSQWRALCSDPRSASSRRWSGTR
jgi:DNA-binding CsgD family transcriptional regulator